MQEIRPHAGPQTLLEEAGNLGLMPGDTPGLRALAVHGNDIEPRDKLRVWHPAFRPVACPAAGHDVSRFVAGLIVDPVDTVESPPAGKVGGCHADDRRCSAVVAIALGESSEIRPCQHPSKATGRRGVLSVGVDLVDVGFVVWAPRPSYRGARSTGARLAAPGEAIRRPLDLIAASAPSPPNRVTARASGARCGQDQHLPEGKAAQVPASIPPCGVT